MAVFHGWDGNGKERGQGDKDWGERKKWNEVEKRRMFERTDKARQRDKILTAIML